MPLYDCGILSHGGYMNEKGQGLVEYTLIVLLVALVFWIGIKNTDIANQLGIAWSKVTDCVTTPTACDSES